VLCPAYSILQLLREPKLPQKAFVTIYHVFELVDFPVELQQEWTCLACIWFYICVTCLACIWCYICVTCLACIWCYLACIWCYICVCYICLFFYALCSIY